MNSWKEAPHLFTNGKFKIQYEGLEKLLEIGGGTSTTYNFYDTEIQMGLTVPYKDCTLIARKISDMSDGELDGIFSSHNTDQKKRILIEQAKAGDMYSWIFLHLLKIGVYPFDNNHNDIIWRYENTNS